MLHAHGWLSGITTMTNPASLRRFCLAFSLLCSVGSHAQQEGPPLGEGPWIFDTYEQPYVRVTLLARGMDHPFGLEFIPGTATADNPLGDILLTERTGQIRLFRDGKLQDEIIADFKDVLPLEQLFDIELHPDFADNGLIYFTYIKKAPRPDGSDGYYANTGLVRAHWDGKVMTDIEEVFEAQAWSPNFGGASSRLHFLPDRTLLFGVSHRLDESAPQRLDSHIGKILRLRDDGSVPPDNPYVGVEGALPEIYSWGIRSVMDFATHPETGEIWELENGPQGGDEVNILKPGANYGWPIATYGRDYDGTYFNPLPWVEGTERPVVAWLPSITVAGMTFYTGNRFPNWRGNLFVTSMIVGRVPGTGHLERVVFNENGEVRREAMLNGLKQRIRYVVQGPDELLYLLTDHSDGALLRLEPLDIAEQATAVESQGPNATPLFSQQDCASCHRLDSPLVGPTYVDIARRYALNDGNVELLANKIRFGGGGSWGEVPMTPHPALSEEDARAMARAILELAQ